MSNYNFGAGYIMNSDKQTVDANIGESKLYREGLEFDTALLRKLLLKTCLNSKLNRLTLAYSHWLMTIVFMLKAENN